MGFGAVGFDDWVFVVVEFLATKRSYDATGLAMREVTNCSVNELDNFVGDAVITIAVSLGKRFGSALVK